MSKQTTFTASLSLFSAVLYTISAPLFADDIEIYTSQTGSAPSADYQPNILFILDTSGSMDATATTNLDGGTTAQEVIDGYDPTMDYLTLYATRIAAEDPDKQCRADRIYRTTNLDKPGRNCSIESSIPLEQFRCKTGAEQMALRGIYQDKAGEYFISDSGTTRNWQNITERSNGINTDPDDPHTRWVDCEADRGTHGYDDTDPDKYMTDGSLQGYGTAIGDEIDWSDRDTYYFFSANYLAYYNYEERMDVLKRAMTNLLQELPVGNIGLMRFSSENTGGMVIHEVRNIADARSALQNAIDTYLVTDGDTPLAETLYEAYNYYSGSLVDYGDGGKWITNVSGHAHNNDDLYSVPESRRSDNYDSYQSPIIKECQKNYVVYLSDGLATHDAAADNEINEDIFGETSSSDWQCSHNDGDDCLDELAKWMYENDLREDIGDTQNVITHTIAFGIDSPELAETAAGAGGKYFTARNAKQLKDALVSTLQEIAPEAATFSAPAVSVNAFNRLTHRNELYFTVFEPSDSPVWQGNLKKFKLEKRDGELIIADANGDPAINELTGLFYDETQSYWSDAADGNNAPQGGAASKMLDTTQAPGGTNLPRPVTYLDGNSADMRDIENGLLNNPLITKDLLNITEESDDYFDDLVKHIRNYDSAERFPTSWRTELGDPLHTEAVAVTYGDTDITIFMATNEGVLHGFNAETGGEVLAYIPEEMLSQQRYNFEPGTSSSKRYGLDGGITTWVEDSGDGTIGSGDFVRLIAGMRRGGRNYYAIDVTNRNLPEFLYHIRPTDPGSPFAELGQTWSRPKLATIKVGGEITPVFVFGGGYDPARDAGTKIDAATEDTLGRAIYIIDAEDGTLIWSGASPNAATPGTDTFDDMDFAIPSEINVLDMNSDGLHDRMYVGDLGGQVWRFDIDNSGASGAALVNGGVIARLGQTAPGATAPIDARRFFYPVDVSLHVDEAGVTGNFLNLAIGSGLRPNPLNLNVQDRIFVLRDIHIYDVPADYTTDYGITEDNLFDTTDNAIGDGSAGEQITLQNELDGSKGWYINLLGESGGPGEKILAKSVTFDGQLIFSSFLTPGTYTPSSCGTPTGRGRLYIVNIADGTPVVNQDGTSDDLTEVDRYRRLQRGGIPPQPTIMFPDADDGNPYIVTGTHITEAPDPGRVRRTYWMRQSQ